MSDKPKRPFLQMHLGTALITMIVTSVLVGLNVVRTVQTRTIVTEAGESIVYKSYSYGWPWPGATDLRIYPGWLVLDLVVTTFLILVCLIVTDRFFRKRESKL